MEKAPRRKRIIGCLCIVACAIAFYAAGLWFTRPQPLSKALQIDGCRSMDATLMQSIPTRQKDGSIVSELVIIDLEAAPGSTSPM